MSDALDHRALMAEFGRRLGFAELAFDAYGSCRIAFDSITLDFEFNRQTADILIHSAVGPLGPGAEREVLQALLEVNLASAFAGAGSLGFDRTTGGLVYVDRVATRGLAVEALERAVRSTVERVEALRRLIGSRAFAGTQMAPAALDHEFAVPIRV